MSTPLGGWTYYFCFFCRLASGRLVSANLKEKYLYYLYQIFMGVHWVNSLHGIAFGEDSSIAN